MLGTPQLFGSKKTHDQEKESKNSQNNRGLKENFA